MTNEILQPIDTIADTDQVLIRRPGSDVSYYAIPADLVTKVNLNPAATASAAGVVELATNAETLTGTDAVRAVTPAGLAYGVTGLVSAATTSVAGKVELATTAEAITGTDTVRAVTPAGVYAALGKLSVISFTGHNNTGACTAVGLKAADVVLMISGLTTAVMGNKSTAFEAVVTTNDQIQQSSTSNYATDNFIAVTFRNS